MVHEFEQSIGRVIYVLDLIAGKYARQILGPHGISKEHLFYLGTLINRGDGITQEELARRLYVDKSSAARMLVVLENKELVRRQPVPGNARANTILVTDKAQKLWDSVLSKLWRWQEILLDGFSERDTRKLLTLLNRMEANAAEAWERGFTS